MIGIYVISKDVNLEYYKSHFMIQDHLLLNCYEHYSYGRILHETLNPIFLKSTRFILKEIMRHIGITNELIHLPSLGIPDKAESLIILEEVKQIKENK